MRSIIFLQLISVFDFTTMFTWKYSRTLLFGHLLVTLLPTLILLPLAPRRCPRVRLFLDSSTCDIEGSAFCVTRTHCLVGSYGQWRLNLEEPGFPSFVSILDFYLHRPGRKKNGLSPERGKRKPIEASDNDKGA